MGWAAMVWYQDCAVLQRLSKNKNFYCGYIHVTIPKIVTGYECSEMKQIWSDKLSSAKDRPKIKFYYKGAWKILIVPDWIFEGLSWI